MEPINNNMRNQAIGNTQKIISYPVKVHLSEPGVEYVDLGNVDEIMEDVVGDRNNEDDVADGNEQDKVIDNTNNFSNNSEGKKDSETDNDANMNNKENKNYINNNFI